MVPGFDKTRRLLGTALTAIAIVTMARPAFAQPESPAIDARKTAPPYTLVVDSDAPNVVSYATLSAGIAKELGAPVAQPGSEEPARAAIEVRYRDGDRSLRVCAIHHGGRVVEREVVAAGHDKAVRREAALLAGNLARDEASELIDELAARKPPPVEVGPEPEIDPPPPVAEPAPPPPPPAAPQERRVAVFSFVYPLATNAGKPDVRTSLSLSLFYGRVGTVKGFELGLGVAHATRDTQGAQIAGAAAVVDGRAHGWQVATGAALALGGGEVAQTSGGFNLASGDVRGFQLAAGANAAPGSLRGAQVGGVNVGGEVRGAQIGIVNIASGKVRGAQVGVVNIASEVDGASIGLVSIGSDSVHPVVWSSNLAYLNAGVKFTTRYVYTLAAIGTGTNEVGFDEARHVLTFGIGGTIPIASRVALDIETAYSEQDVSGPGAVNRSYHLRAISGYAFAKHFRLVAGFGLRIPLAFDQGSLAVRPEGMAGVQF